MFDFNITSNPHSYLALFVPKTLSVVWYFIMDLIPLKFHSYLALFKSKSMVIFICFHCLIIFFKLCKITQTLCGVFSSSNLNLSSSQTVDLVSFYFIFLFFLFLEHRVRVRSQDTENKVEGSRTDDVIQHGQHILASCHTYGY